jgi:cobalamin synthase
MPALSRWTINFQLLRFNDFSSRGSLTEIFLNHKNKKSFMTASAYLFIFYVLSNAFAGFFLKDKFLFNNFSWIINNFSIKNGNLMLIVIIPVFKSLIMISLIILIAETAGRFFIRKIGRLSGDAIGAVVEMTEIIYLFLVYIFIFIF